MRTKALLTSILLASTAIAGVASADPIIRDHRDPVQVSYRAPVRYQHQIRVQSRPSWMVNASANVNYGFQVDGDGDEVQPYQYGQDPYVEGIARGEWSCFDDSVALPPNGMVRIALNADSMRAVELQQLRGDMNVRQISVQYTDGHILPVRMSRELDAHSPNLRLDLGSEGLRGVSAIVVYGGGQGTFRVLGA